MYTYKIINLSQCQMENLKNRMRYFIKHGVKCTFKKKVAWIHLDENQLYTVITGMMKNYECSGQLVVKVDVKHKIK